MHATLIDIFSELNRGGSNYFKYASILLPTKYLAYAQTLKCRPLPFPCELFDATSKVVQKVCGNNPV
jgi:hypothetical protein